LRDHPHPGIYSYNCACQSRCCLLRPDTQTHHPPLSSTARGDFHDTHDVHDLTTNTSRPQQPQQLLSVDPAAASLSVPSHPASASGNGRPLQRVQPHSERPPVRHRRVGSVDVSSRVKPSAVTSTRETRVTPVHRLPAVRVEPRPIVPALSEVETEEEIPGANDPINQPIESYWPPRTTQVSPRTASAIRWVLEEAVRKAISLY